ncbi:MAG: hypothetical protein IPH07_19030 [Deltaproteobacteria bacterium]|nr:hypothetical protein [Deltaproteobacteria bacterium]MBK8715797.1 hypothetical protein [Deltaproteobacteria bacterium]MBP7288124.1 hypothetical protein [Nannocystaceae bacterium]
MAPLASIVAARLLLAPDPAHADVDPWAGEPAASFGAVQLRWRGLDGCPDLMRLSAEIRAGLGVPPAPGDPLALRIDAQVQALDAGQLELAATTTSATGHETRTWVVDSCEVAAELTAALVTSAIDQANLEPLEPLPPPTPGPRAAAPIAPAPTPSAAPQQPPPRWRTRPGFAVRASAGFEAGGLPKIGAGFALAVALTWRWLRVEAMASQWLPREASSDGGAKARILLTTATLRGCAQARLGRRVELMPGCTGIELGSAFGRGENLDLNLDDQVLWAAWDLGAGLAVRAHRRLRVMIDAHAAIPLGSPRFEIRNEGAIWRAAVGVRVLAGLEIVLADPRRRRRP